MTQPTISDFSTTAASNADYNAVGILGTSLLSTADDAFRMLAAMLAGYSKDLAGIGQTVGGSANAITLTVAQPWAALANGLIVGFKNTGGPNTTAVTLAVTNSVAASLGTKAIRLQGDAALTGGEMVANGVYLLRYDTSYNAAAGAWVLLNGGGFQPLDSDLTTIAGLTATTDSFMQAKSSAWAARTIAQVKADLGLATGQTLRTFFPRDNEPPSSAYATFSTRNGHSILVFPDAVTYSAIFTGILPAAYAGGGLTVEIEWMCSTTSTNKICLGGYIEYMDVGTTDFDSDSLSSEVIDTTGVAANATSGISSKTSIPFTNGAQMDSLVAGATFRLKITRETGQANDTNAGDCQVLAVRVKET